MGFLKFLKREKKEGLDELDLPPEPPPLEGFHENLPELPEFPDIGKDISGMEYIPKFDFPEKEAQGFQGFPDDEAQMPLLEDAPEPADAAPLISEPAPQIPQSMAELQQVQQAPTLMPHERQKTERRKLFAHEETGVSGIPIGKTIYIKVDRFKATLGSINIVRNDLRKSEEALAKLETIKAAKDRSFEKIKSSLDDLQKKLIFVDKTLFKGD